MNRTQNNNQEGFQWGPFILGVLSIILAFFAFNHPVVSIVFVTILWLGCQNLTGFLSFFDIKPIPSVFSGIIRVS